MRKEPPVLGLFANEAELRDHIANSLDLIEPGLRLLEKEHPVSNPTGAGGRIDILAVDPFGHVVCIEIKRSNNSSRSTLNELSKYVNLLAARSRIPREMVRCIVVSTDWDELLLPLSYFANTTGAHVTAFEAVRHGDGIELQPVELKQVQHLPQLCPDMDLIWFESPEPRGRSIEIIQSRASQLPFVRLALMLFAPKSPNISTFPLLICVWRVEDGQQEQIEVITGKPIGSNYPYAAPGWEPESDASQWIGKITSDEVPEHSRSWSQGTSERVASVLIDHDLASVIRLGDWPDSDVVNDDARILDAVLARSPRGGMGRANRHSYQATVSSEIASSWRLSVDGFLDFISFEPSWRERAAKFLADLPGTNVTVQLLASDKRHLIYSIHQARSHPAANLGWFEIVVSKDDQFVAGVRGDYIWDGSTCPTSADEAIEKVYGSLLWARLAIMSSVDDRRYESAHRLHGFRPVLAWIESGAARFSTPLPWHSFTDFVTLNPEYCEAMSAKLNSIGYLPSSPNEGRGSV